MTKFFNNTTILSGVTSSGIGTAYHVARAESWTSTVVYTTTGSTVNIIVEGTTAPTSTGTYVTISSVTTTGAVSGSYDISKALTPYNYVRAQTLSHTTTGTVVTVSLMTQSEGY